MSNHLKRTQELHVKAQGSTTEALTNRIMELESAISDFSGELSHENVDSVIKLFNSGLYKLDFRHAIFFNTVAKKFKTFDKTNEKHLSLNLHEIRNIQQIILECKFSTPVEAEIIANGITAFKSVNDNLNALEEEIQIFSVEAQRRMTEEKTGLEFSEEDKEIVANLEPRPDAIVEASKGVEGVIVEEQN